MKISEISIEFISLPAVVLGTQQSLANMLSKITQESL